MREVRASAPGKVNLTLRVGAPTPDGYHPLVTVFEALNLRETVTVRTSKAPGVRVETIAYLPDGSVDEATTRAMADVDPQTHLAVRAARVLQRLAAAGPWASTAAGLSIRVVNDLNASQLVGRGGSLRFTLRRGIGATPVKRTQLRATRKQRASRCLS